MLYGVVHCAIMLLEVFPMKLNYDRKSKDPTYFIQVGIRNGKKVTTKNVARIGKHSDLLKITDDPLEYAKQKVREYNDQIKNSKVEYHITVDFDEKLINQATSYPDPPAVISDTSILRKSTPLCGWTIIFVISVKREGSSLIPISSLRCSSFQGS